MKLYSLAILLCLASCQKEEEITPQKEPAPPTEWVIINYKEPSIAVTGDAFNVGPVSADVYMYINLDFPLITDEESNNKAYIQYCSDGLFANAQQIFPVLNQDETGAISIYENKAENRALVKLFNLEPNTTYQYRAKVVIGKSTRYGQTRSFTTKPLDLPLNGFVDLGLSVQWSSANLDAENITDVGRQCTQSEALELSLPTAENYQELIDNCVLGSAIYQGKRGMMVTGSSGKSIFFPECSTHYHGPATSDFAPVEVNLEYSGSYWTSTQGKSFYFLSKGSIVDSNVYFHRCVRLVQ